MPSYMIDRRTKSFLIAGLVSLTLSACGAGKLLGVDRQSPDEFQVVNKPPLIMPPDFNEKPPRPGEPTAQNLTASARAVNALFPGRTTLPPPKSAGEEALLRTIGAGSSGGDIRSTVADEDTTTVEKGSLLADIRNVDQRSGDADGSDIERVASEPIDSDQN